MVVADIMTGDPVTIRPDQTLHKAIWLMQQVGCHHLPVISSNGHVIGIVTEKDCRVALRIPHLPSDDMGSDHPARHEAVRSWMSPAPIIVEPDTPVEEAARLMLAHAVSCLPVMRGETLIGIITTSDILAAFIRMSKNVPVT